MQFKETVSRIQVDRSRGMIVATQVAISVTVCALWITTLGLPGHGTRSHILWFAVLLVLSSFLGSVVLTVLLVLLASAGITRPAWLPRVFTCVLIYLGAVSVIVGVSYLIRHGSGPDEVLCEPDPRAGVVCS
jgi:hypothetical protein